MQRISRSELRDDLSTVLRRVQAGQRLRITVAGRDAADIVPIDHVTSWTSGARAQELIDAARADAGLADELATSFSETTDEL